MGMRFTDRGQAGSWPPPSPSSANARTPWCWASPAAVSRWPPQRSGWTGTCFRSGSWIPGHGETAFGALAAVDGRVVRVLNRPFVDELLEPGIPQSALDEVVRIEQAELERRAGAYPGPRLPLAGRTVIVADDGMATGASMRAAADAVVSLFIPGSSAPWAAITAPSGRCGTATSSGTCRVPGPPEQQRGVRYGPCGAALWARSDPALD